MMESPPNKRARTLPLAAAAAISDSSGENKARAAAPAAAADARVEKPVVMFSGQLLILSQRVNTLAASTC
jgi:hypothetical protein